MIIKMNPIKSQIEEVEKEIKELEDEKEEDNLRSVLDWCIKEYEENKNNPNIDVMFIANNLQDSQKRIKAINNDLRVEKAKFQTLKSLEPLFEKMEKDLFKSIKIWFSRNKDCVIKEDLFPRFKREVLAIKFKLESKG